jgi:hypothetical protein
LFNPRNARQSMALIQCFDSPVISHIPGILSNQGIGYRTTANTILRIHSRVTTSGVPVG